MTWLLTVIYTISFLFPGIFEAYAAYKVFPFIKSKGGLILFVFLSLSAQFDILYSILICWYVVVNFGKTSVSTLNWSDPVAVGITIYFLTSLFLWRLASGMMALWFSGKVTETLIRRVLGIKEE